MRKIKTYHNVKFTSSTVENFYNAFKARTKLRDESSEFQVTVNESETWQYDTFEEFLAEYPKASHYVLRLTSDTGRSNATLEHSSPNLIVFVRMPTRPEIEAIFQTLERDLEKAIIKPDSPVAKSRQPIKIFIGHGRNEQWRDLKDHLHEKHGYDVVAYEIGPRAGLTIKEVLEKMLSQSSIAFLVLTGEDQTNDGELHARQNVIHEVGLFQGRLGFQRAIVLLESGVTEFSNIHGVNQIRFAKGNIKETFGDVLATIAREFKEAD
jgi:predicted nucleotide-binding protein